MNSSDITVVMPVYNNAAYIKEAINSIRNQTLGDAAEIIVIDDGSLDDSAKQAGSMNVQVLHTSHKGAATARNEGLKHVKTPFIYLLDADDVAAPEAFAILAGVMENHCGVGEDSGVKEKRAESRTAVEPQHKEDTACMEEGEYRIMAVFALAQDFISEELSDTERKALQPREGAYSGILPGCTLIRSEVFEQIGLFDETLSSGEVVDWMMRFRESGMKKEEVAEVTLKRRLHMTNTGRLQKKMEAANYAAILRKRLRMK